VGVAAAREQEERAGQDPQRPHGFTVSGQHFKRMYW
jgi:hypothetical protein